MSSYRSVFSDKLSRLIGTANAPSLDVRVDDDLAADPRLIPGATRRSHLNVQEWAPTPPLERLATAGTFKVVAFDTVPEKNRGAAEVNYWSDVPPNGRNYSALRDAIVHHIDDLVRESLQGE